MAVDPKRLLKPAKKLRKLVRKLDRHPPPEEVHALRTNTRRFEAAFEALMLESQGDGKSIMKDLRRCRKRAGKVRDMDVLTGYASTVHLTGEEDCAVRLLEHLGAQRRKYASKLYAEVHRRRSSLRKDLKRTAAILTELVQANGDRPSGSAAGSQAAGTAARLAVQLTAPEHLNRENLHPYRLKVKELRNILQMASGGTTRFADDLAQVKDAIGEWHDWEQLVSIAQDKLDHGSRCELVAELKRITARKYGHALALAQALRRHYFRRADSQKHRTSPASSSIPREPVWEEVARLAG